MSHSDRAIERLEDDWLDRRRAVEALFDVLHDDTTTTPLVVGVYGGWGTGKTSVLNMLRCRLEATSAGVSTRALALWFDAWRYARQEQSLWRALLLSVTASLKGALAKLPEAEVDRKRVARKLGELEDSLYRSATVSEKGGLKVNWDVAVPRAADLALGVMTSGVSTALAQAVTGETGWAQKLVNVFKGDDAKKAMKIIDRQSRERYVAQVTSLEQFQRALREALQTMGVDGGKVGARSDGRVGRRLYLFVDDLDRCLPEDAVAALEAIKLFLDLPGCIFVLAMDRGVVEQGIRVRYKAYESASASLPFDPSDYLDKVVQLPFSLPPLHITQVESYLDRLSRVPGNALVASCRDLWLAGEPPNPRALKRMLNVHGLLLRTAGWDGKDTETGWRTKGAQLAKLVALQMQFESAYRLAVDNRVPLRELESRARKGPTGSGWNPPELNEERLRNLLKTPPAFAEMDDHELATLLTLTAAMSPPPKTS
jgi:hypothetical protein